MIFVLKSSSSFSFKLSYPSLVEICRAPPTETHTSHHWTELRHAEQHQVYWNIFKIFNFQIYFYLYLISTSHISWAEVGTYFLIFEFFKKIRIKIETIKILFLIEFSKYFQFFSSNIFLIFLYFLKPYTYVYIKTCLYIYIFHNSLKILIFFINIS